MNSPLLKKALPHIIAVALFLIIAIIYCKPVFDGKVVNQSDVLHWKGMAQQSFEYKEKHGHFPLWTESAFSGMPAYTIAMDATSKISTGYLSYLVTFGLPEPVSYLFLACICFYILTQVLRINPWIGILASLAYCYSTFNLVLINVGHNTQIQAIGYAPGVIASVILIYQKKYLLGSALLIIFFGLQVGTQHLQIAYYTSIALAILSLVFLIYNWKQKDIKSTFIAFAITIISGAIGFGTYAVSMLPFQEYAKETKRGGKTALINNLSDKNKTKGGFDKDYAFMWSYGISEPLSFIVPNIFGGGSEGRLISGNSKFAEKAAEIGYPEDNALQIVNTQAYWGTQLNTAGPVYIGAIICFLTIFSLVYLKSWHKWWLMAISVFGILLAWGNNFSLLNYFLFDHMPMYNKFRAPTQALFLVQFAFPLLAALGLDQLLNNKEQHQIIWKKFLTAAYITAGILVILVAFYFTADFKTQRDNRIKDSFSEQILQSSARGKQPTPEMQQQAIDISSSLIKGLQADRQSIYGSDLIRTILLIAVAVILLGLYLKSKIKPVILITGLIVLSSYDLLAEGRVYLNEDNFAEPSDYESAFNPTPADIQISKDPDQNFRVLNVTAPGGPFQDASTSYHHNSVGGYSPAKLGLYQDIIDSQLNKNNIMVYNMLNTKYIIQRNPATGQEQAALNAGAFGPCWLVKSIRYVKDGSEEMKALDSINVKDTVIVEQQYQKIIKFGPQPDSTATLSLVENLNDKIKYHFTSKTNQFAVFSEVYYDKGWNVFIDGNKADYCRVDYILRGMPVPAGNHTIEFRFEPAIYKLGNTISVLCSIIGYLLLIAAIYFSWRKKSIAK
ncbi:MAG: YfhO family protein [Bacteroidetes bacterium]|nr:YfhO family protein [Bacteroidota bacterium]